MEKRDKIMRRDLSSQCYNSKKKNGDKAYCDNVGFFEFDQSCWFYQSFQTPPEQAHQQTCFGYHVLGHHKQNLPQSLEYNRIYRTHWTNQED